jgi:hypothetical protein
MIMTMRSGVPLVGFFCTLAFFAAIAHAQLDFGIDFVISTQPEHPRPGDAVRVSVKSVLLDLESGTVAWYVNGTRRASGVGLKETEVTVGPLGSATRVRAVFIEEGFERTAAEIVIRPVEIDLLWEADSYVPLTFRGRSLPSAGTSLHMEALPRFKRADGSSVLPRDIIFTWKRNGYVIAGASGRGKSRVVLESPPLFGTDTMSVEARTTDGSFIAETNVRIPSTEPIISLYEDHPLFGVMYHRALGSENFFSGVETSFAAIPYFADAEMAESPDLAYEWKVDENSIANDPERPNEITLNAEGSSGIALIGLTLSHASNIFLNANGAWRVLLGTDLGLGAGNPFGGN